MAANDDTAGGFTAEEKAAMKDRAAEARKAKARKGKQSPAEDAADVLAKIAELGDADRALAERVHDIIAKAAPSLAPKLWYGMPAYARDGKVVCFFQGADKFKSRYSTLGFNDAANLDDGAMWPTAFALTDAASIDEQAIAALVARAVG
ncbi:DUF1801 domain-containing protein [Microbacterium sp. cx-55]|uniref:iron chaperone n=1 Tax=Microbacterium sp. cx-55 TaxID=2875948 RepID=UPI001CBEB266|nr:DUF1801 domain-containing protein [Microbacterium sp. cx-55]MBZ4486484.1 DUF1801 domain-containing protein [Microbacterium sp. cx-55]UGB36547.1 DUF1801 domain-containing protein [Microbacterium sp. cx-55]